MSSRHIYVVQTNAVSGREDEFNEWYSNVHLRDILSIDGWTAAARFRLHDPSERGEPYPYRYLAIYEMEGDVQENLRRMSAKMRSGVHISSAMAPDPSAHVFTPIGARLTRE
jgi:hypothetical protein